MTTVYQHRLHRIDQWKVISKWSNKITEVDTNNPVSGFKITTRI